MIALRDHVNSTEIGKKNKQEKPWHSKFFVSGYESHLGKTN